MGSPLGAPGNRIVRVQTPKNWPAGECPQTRGSNGVTYTMAPPGQTTDLPLDDAHSVAANGFLLQGFVGPSAQRPSYMDADWRTGNLLSVPGCTDASGRLRFFDTTLGAWIVFDRDAGIWRNFATGAGPV